LKKAKSAVSRRFSALEIVGIVVISAGAIAAVANACARDARTPAPPPVIATEPAPEARPAGPADSRETVSCEPPTPDARTTRFAVIGDYGQSGHNEAAVARLVQSMQPEFVITTGDNNYTYGEAQTIDANIGQYYADFICPYVGRYGAGSEVNRFFPSLGNHDWLTPTLRPYLDYFQLPGNERYYDLVWGYVHLFAIDSDPHEPDGIDASSAQARWLKQRLSESKVRWQIVYMHHPPYSSGAHGSSPELRWPYAEWGADLVLAGHDHHYERIEIAGTTYVVNGLGGRSIYPVGKPIEGSVVRYAQGFGAQFVEASAARLVSRFLDVGDKSIDERVLGD
jgi:hypothetical protein